MRLYLRRSNYDYDPSEIQIVTEVREKAFDFAHIRTWDEIEVWEDGVLVERWFWDAPKKQFYQSAIL